jgi:hypothetical protein
VGLASKIAVRFPWPPARRAAGRGLPLAAFVLALATALPFARVIFARQVLYERDIQAIRWGQLEAFARCLAAGSWPLWNTLDSLGRPMLANPGSQVLYPFTWLSIALSPPDYYDLYAYAHVLFAGLGAFLLARRLAASYAAALFSGALFLMSGPVLSTTNLWQHLAGVAWLPWVLAAGDAALARPTLARTLAWGSAVAVQVLTGSLDFVLLGAAAQAVLAWRQLGLPGTGRREAGRRVAAAAGAATLAVGLSAAQWVPALALLRGAARSGLGERAQQTWSLHPALLVQTLAPAFPQDLPLTTATRQALYDGREPLLFSIYLGAAALPFVVAGLLARPRRTPLLLALLGLLAAAVALGKHALAYFWLLDLVPVLHLFRFPAKTLVLLALAWALLAGLGLDAWRGLARGARAAACGISWGAAVVLALTWWSAGGWAGVWMTADPLGRPLVRVLAPVLALLLPAAALEALTASLLFAAASSRRVLLAALLAAGELALAHRGVPATLPAAFFAPTPGLVAAAKADGVARLQVFDYLYRREESTGSRWKTEDPAAFRALPRSLQRAMEAQEYPPDGSRWGVRGGFSPDVAELESHARRSLTLLVRYYQGDAVRLWRLLRLGGVTHLATRHAGGLEGFALRAEVRTARIGTAYLFRVPEPLPRAYAVEGVRVAAGRDAYALLVDDGFDAGREVVLAAGTPRAPEPGFLTQVRLLEDRPDRIRVEASLSRRGQLVVLEGFDPGWHALVDGRSERPQPANAVFLSLPLEAGRHEVELVYRPASVTLGFAVSAASALLAGLLLVPGVRRARAPGGR